MGFPSRPDLAALGPTVTNLHPVGNPEKEATAEQWNAVRWQVAGMGLVCYRAHLIFAAAAGSQPIRSRQEVWNPRALASGAHANPTITRIGTGQYDVVYPSPVPDDLDALVALSFRHGVGVVVTPSQATFRLVMVTPLSGTPAGVKVMVLDAAGSAVDGHDVSILIG